MAKGFCRKSFCACTNVTYSPHFGSFEPSIELTFTHCLLCILQKLPLLRIYLFSFFIDSLHAKVLKYLKLLLAIRHAGPSQRRTLTNTNALTLTFYSHTRSTHKWNSLFHAFDLIRFRFVCTFGER